LPEEIVNDPHLAIAVNYGTFLIEGLHLLRLKSNGIANFPDGERIG